MDRAMPRPLVIDSDPLISQTIATAADSLSAQARRHASDTQSFFTLPHEWQPTPMGVDLHMPVIDG